MLSRRELEQRVMELLWASDTPKSAAEVHAGLSQSRELAYTTVMMVLDRLAKQGLVLREMVDHAWRYQAAGSQAEVVARDLLTRLAPLPAPVRADTLRCLASGLSEHDLGAMREASQTRPHAQNMVRPGGPGLTEESCQEECSNWDRYNVS